MLYWNSDHFLLLSDLSFALAFSNINTFAELVVIAGSLLSNDAFQRGASWAREWRRPPALSSALRVRVLTADEIWIRASPVPFVSLPWTDPGSCTLLSSAQPSFYGLLSPASLPESAGSSAF